MQRENTSLNDPGVALQSARPLEGLLVVDLSQFLAGPYASLKLLDMGARVIKIEHPERGDLSRTLYSSDTDVDGESTIFHAINRGKESLALNLKNDGDLAALKTLVKEADVFIQNFRPGVVNRLGLGTEVIHQLNPQIIYASISGYGENGPWSHRPGQDLLVQACSGAMWLSGKDNGEPVPFGLPVADMFAGANLLQAILGALVGRGTQGKGALVQTSLLEAMIELQFEVLTTYLNDGRRLPKRSSVAAGHAYLAAPYGIYQTADGWLAIAMTPVNVLADCLEVEALLPFANNPDSWFEKRDHINAIIADTLSTKSIWHVVRVLEENDIWSAQILDWNEFLNSEAFQNLNITETLKVHNIDFSFISSPVRFNGMRNSLRSCGPTIGQHNEALIQEFALF